MVNFNDQSGLDDLRWGENSAPAEHPGGTTVPYYEVFVSPRVRENRLLVLSIVLGVALIGAFFAIKEMLPLHRFSPYFLESDDSSGEVRLSAKVASEFKPDEANLKYFLNLWISRALSMSKDSKDTLLPLAYEWCRDKAKDELQELVIEREKMLERLERDRYFIRETRQATITFPFPRVAHVSVPVVDRPSSGETRMLKKVMVIHFELLPVVTQKDAARNPIGLAITHFTIDDEVVR
jgi:type IV secretory pathway component VirB8